MSIDTVIAVVVVFIVIFVSVISMKKKGSK